MKKELTQEIKLDNGIIVTIPVKYKYAKCKGCLVDDLIWATTKNGKFMPIRFDINKKVWISHFSDCAQSDKFRK
jgi:hypothetical protein